MAGMIDALDKTVYFPPVSGTKRGVTMYNQTVVKQPIEFTKKDIQRVFLCVLSGVIMSVNLRTFVHTGGLLPGGIAGLTILIQEVFTRFFGIELPYGVPYIILNLGPIWLGFKKIGKKFTLYSCITILTVTMLTDLIPLKVLTYDVLLISVFGGIVNGFAISLALRAGATTGGTDFVSIYISEKYGVDAWNYILGFNAVILICGGFLFGWDAALYSIIFQFASTQIIHMCYKRYSKNTLFIVTDKPAEVTSVIDVLTRHGATSIDVTGTFEDAKRTMIYSVVGSEELPVLMTEIRKVDEKAFVNVIKTEELSGRFVMRPND